MRRFKDDLVNKIIDLYNMYERYIWKHDDVKLDVLIQDGAISFYLYNSICDFDELIVDFSKKEHGLYKYVCVRILLMLSRDCIIYQDDNIFYNNVHKPYLKLIVNDDVIKNVMSDLVVRQNTEIINENTDIISDINDSVEYLLFYPRKFMNKLDERIGISKKLLRNGGSI